MLEAYNNKCAICDISEPNLLVAAHILDVKYGGEEIISNGICLCINHERAFDNKVLTILPDYSVNSKAQIGITVESIKLPENVEYYPNPEFFRLKNQKNN